VGQSHRRVERQEGHPARQKTLLQNHEMNYNHRNLIPARTSPGQTRSVPPSTYPVGGIVKYGRGTLKIGSANVGTMTGRSGEIVKMAERRDLDFCCLQETRWKGGSARVIGSYKFFWVGCEKGVSGVGVLVADRWVDSIIEVKRVSERILVLRVVVGKSVLNLVSAYAPQSGRPIEEKEDFYACLGETIGSANSKERYVVCGDMNGHVGEKSDGFCGVHGGHGFGHRNLEGEMLLEFADARNLAVMNTWFKKDEGKLITYDSGGCRTTVDYILIGKEDRKMVRNVGVVRGECCLPQHKLLLCVVDWVDLVKKKGEVFVSRTRVWRLKKAEVREAMQRGVQAGELRRDDGDLNVQWGSFRDCVLDVAEKVCGKTRGRQRHRETWWWNDEVAKSVREKQRLFRIYQRSKYNDNSTDNGRNIAQNKLAYNLAKYETKKTIQRSQTEERIKFGDRLEGEDRKGNVFRVVKQMVRCNRDITGGGSVKDVDGKVLVDEEKIRERWRTHYDQISNEEFDWSRENLSGGDVVSGPCERITTAEVRQAIFKMKNNKAAGPSGVVADMIKAAGEGGVRWITDICNLVIKEGRVPDDWSKSHVISVFKGKGDALECGSYRGIKLLEHAMKILERVIEVKVRNMVKIDDMQFGFVAGKGTTDAIFIVRQLQEKYLANNQDLWMAFVDLEKAFDRVPREVLWWALRELGVPEWIVVVIKAMYDKATTVVKHNGNESKEFTVRVGVHQGSVLSPLLFIIVLEALSKRFREGLPTELLYADDLVLIAITREQLMEKLQKWRVGMEEKGLRVNVTKTKVMRCRKRNAQVENSGKWPCRICKKGVGTSSIRCTLCRGWVHRRCSGISVKLQGFQNFQCMCCVNREREPANNIVEDEVIEQGVGFEMVDRFCYLGDTIGAGGGVEEATRARVRSAWAKFRELSPILTTKGASLRVKGKVYKACVQSVLIYGSETWAVRVEDVGKLERAERMMVRWMCGVTLRDRIASVDLYSRLGLEEVGAVLRRGRLRWFGHLERKNVTDWVSACRSCAVVGSRSRGRGKKSWCECVKGDMKAMGLRAEWARDRVRWRGLLSGKRLTRASMDKRT